VHSGAFRNDLLYRVNLFAIVAAAARSNQRAMVICPNEESRRPICRLRFCAEGQKNDPPAGSRELDDPECIGNPFRLVSQTVQVWPFLLNRRICWLNLRALSALKTLDNSDS
jgi:hypothetical protein